MWNFGSHLLKIPWKTQNDKNDIYNVSIIYEFIIWTGVRYICTSPRHYSHKTNFTVIRKKQLLRFSQCRNRWNYLQIFAFYHFRENHYELYIQILDYTYENGYSFSQTMDFMRAICIWPHKKSWLTRRCSILIR